MGTFGDKLKREREMRGITLDEIAESTKIARRHLEAIEKENFDALPGRVFIKGFIRSYARFIGIDEEQAVADFTELHKEDPAEAEKFPLEIHEEPDRDLNPRRSHLPLIGAVVALVLVMSGYAVWRSKHRALETESVSASTAVPHQSARPADGAAATTDRPLQSQLIAAPPPPPMPVTTARVEVASASVPAAAHMNASATTPDRPSHKSSDAQPQEKTALPIKTFFIVIKAKEDAWVSIVADGRRVVHGVLRADKQRLIRAGKQVIVTTANAGGIDLSFNGRALGVIGNESEARTLMFTPAGPVEQ
jgi:cytoskeleton protein RodZ